MSKLIKSEYWVVRKCLWPYPEGYATYNKKTEMILDTGLSKEDAERICKRLNERENQLKQ